MSLINVHADVTNTPVKTESVPINRKRVLMLLSSRAQPTLCRRWLGLYHLRLVLSVPVYHINGVVGMHSFVFGFFTSTLFLRPTEIVMYVSSLFIFMTGQWSISYLCICLLMGTCAFSTSHLLCVKCLCAFLLKDMNVSTWMISEYNG